MENTNSRKNLLSALTEVARLKPEIRLAQAISEFSLSLGNDKDKHVRFKNLQTRIPPSSSEIVQLTEEINRDGARRHKAWRPHATRLLPMLERMRQFAPIGDVLIGGAQNLLASGVWAAVRLALDVSVAVLSYFDAVSALLMRLGRSMSLNQDFAMLFPQCQQTQIYMCEYTITMVQICKLVVTNTPKSFVSQVASSFGSTFESTFKPLEKDLLDWGQLIEKRTAMLVAKSNIGQHSTSLHRFNRLQVALSRESARRQREAKKLHLLTSICSDQSEFDAIWRRERKRGTSNWILKVTPYQSWLQCPISATIWLQGNLGSGKTVTMASVIAHLSLSDAQSKGSIPARKSQLRTVSFFFCKNANQKTLVAMNILGSLVFQVISCKAIAPFLEEFLGNEDIDRPIAPDFIVRLLVQITPRNWQGIFVLDGLDEAPVEEIDELFSHLKVLMGQRHILLCCSSRPTSTCKVIAASFTTINWTLSMEGVDRSEDMRSFISADIERWKLIRPLSPTLEKLAIEQLLVGSQGMFLWLSLQLEAICPKYTQELRSEAEILGILNNLPRNLPEAFDQALLRTTDCRFGSRIFQLVAAADPALSVDELRVAVNVELGIVAWNSSTLVGPGLRLAALYGGSLLDIDEEDLCVRFIHHSALLHLLRPPAIASAAAFHFDFHDAEVTFGAVCVTYLNYTVFENQLSTAKKVSFSKVPEVVTDSVLGPTKISKRVFAILSKKHRISKSGIDLEKLSSTLQSHRFQVSEDVHIFLAYATENWISTTRVFSESIDPGIYDLWALLVSGHIPSVAPSLPWTAESAKSATDWAIQNNHGLLFRHLLRTQNKVDLAEVVNTALQLARDQRQRMNDLGENDPSIFCLSGSSLGLLLPRYLLRSERQLLLEDIDLLVERGCLPFRPGSQYESLQDPPLAYGTLGHVSQLAILQLIRRHDGETAERLKMCRCFDAIMLLAHHLPTIDTILTNGRTLLLTFIEHCYEAQALELLTKRRASINGPQSVPIPTPLKLSLQTDLRFVARYLIQRGADIFADPDGKLPPFLFSIEKHDVEMFQLMHPKDAGRMTWRYGPRQETVFQFACRKYCESELRQEPFLIAKDLLHDGANVNLPNGAGESPLIIAAKSQSDGPAIIRWLLEAGANPNTTNEDGLTPLHLVHGYAISILLHFGAQADAFRAEGVTPLMVAALYGDFEGLGYLMKSGVALDDRTPGHGRLSDKCAMVFTARLQGMKRDASQKAGMMNAIRHIMGGQSALSIAFVRLESLTPRMESLERGYRDTYASEYEEDRDLKVEWRNMLRVTSLLIRVEETREDLHLFRVNSTAYEHLAFWQPIIDLLKGHSVDENAYVTYDPR